MACSMVFATTLWQWLDAMSNNRVHGKQCCQLHEPCGML